MSMSYCYYCLEQDADDNTNCLRHGDKVVFGELRVQYLRGYEDARDGKPEQIDILDRRTSVNDLANISPETTSEPVKSANTTLPKQSLNKGGE